MYQEITYAINILLLSKSVMRKPFISFFLSISFLFLLSQSVHAVSVSPSSGTFPISGNKTISIVAKPTSASSGIKLRLVVDNAKVVSYNQPTGGVLSIGVCDSNGSMFRSVSSTKYEICVDMAKTGGSSFTTGTSLGSIVVASLNSSGGSFTISGGTNNGYLTAGNGVSSSTGVLGSYTFSNSSVSVLPNTAISDYMPSRGILGAAILFSGLVSMAVAVKVFLLDKRKELF